MSHLQGKLIDKLHSVNKAQGKFDNVWGSLNLLRACKEYAGLEHYDVSDVNPGKCVLSKGQSLKVSGRALIHNPQFLRFDPNATVAFDSNNISCYKLSNVAVSNWYDFHVVWDSNGINQAASSSVWPLLQNIKTPLYDIAYPDFISPDDITIDLVDSAFLLASDTTPSNYCHFVADVLPMLSFLEDICEDEVHIISPVMQPLPYENTFIDSFNERKNRTWISIQNGNLLRVKNLYYLRYTGGVHPFFNCSSWAIDFVRSLMSGKYLPTQLTKDYLLINRKRRRVLNLTELLDNLSISSTCTYVENFEDFSVEEQITLFASHKHIICPHGAALTNIVFKSRFPLCVTEIVPLGSGMATFARLSNKLGIKHRVYGCKSIITDHPNYPDAILDIDEFIKFISSDS